MRTPKKYNDNWSIDNVVKSVSISKDLWAKIEALKDKTGISCSKIVVEFIEQGLKNSKKKIKEE